MRYTNPFSPRKDFVYLGQYSEPSNPERVYDLYALTNNGTPGEISLGARYSDRDSYYLSGFLLKRDFGIYDFTGQLPIAVAAIRYLGLERDKLAILNER